MTIVLPNALSSKKPPSSSSSSSSTTTTPPPTVSNGISSSSSSSSSSSNNTPMGHVKGSHSRTRGGGGGGGRGGATCCGFLSALVLVGFLAAAVIVFKRQELGDFVLYTGYHDGDQVAVSRVADSYSTLLCQTYTVTACSDNGLEEEGASFFLTDGPATLSSQVREVIGIRNSGLRSKEQFDYRAFYLLPGSVIETGACMSIFNEFPSRHAEVVFIKGDNHFFRWAQDSSSCADCVAYRVPITPEHLCEGMQGVLARYVVEDADTYHIVVTRQHRSQDDAVFRADVYINVFKTTYDLSHVKQKCLWDSSCTFNLTYDAKDDVIVDFPLQEGGSSGNCFKTYCGMRIEFFLIIFLLVPGCLIFLLTVMSCMCCKENAWQAKTRTNQLRKKKAEVKAALLP